MRIHVNLATRPFVELRPFFLRLRLLMAALAVVAIALATWSHFEKKKLRTREDELGRLHAATVAAQQDKNRNEARMRQPANAEVLERAHFLNGLFVRKSFSWTAVMMDLENVLPTGVQVTAIEPSVNADGGVAIRLRVGGERDRAVQLVRNLERSRRFLQPRLSSESTQAKEGPNGAAAANPALASGVEFDILALYNPLPANESYHFAKPRVDAVAAPSTSVIAPVPPGSIPARPAMPVNPAAQPARPPYPRNGVLLRPFVPPARPAASRPAPPARPLLGGGR